MSAHTGTERLLLDVKFVAYTTVYRCFHSPPHPVCYSSIAKSFGRLEEEMLLADHASKRVVASRTNTNGFTRGLRMRKCLVVAAVLCLTCILASAQSNLGGQLNE